MVLIFLIWIIIFSVMFVFGFSIFKVIRRNGRQKGDCDALSPDEYFFSGFLILSAFSAFLSIFIPVGYKILILVCLIALLLFLINFREIEAIFKEVVRRILLLKKQEFLILLFLIFFILSAVVQRITLGDTESYHAQSIQWIRKYAVVPGLGNIHGRLAFNSLFFVISGLFTFQIRDILIFPLNGICYIVLLIRLFFLYTDEDKIGSKWKSVFYVLVLLISLLMMIPNLNSPAPDVICGILIMYVSVYIFNLLDKGTELTLSQIILLSLVVFSCITYKLSSIFLIFAFIPFIKRDFIKKGLIVSGIGILVISPFIIRNYYLSGYLLYPFPSLDIFHVDWKIPFQNVLAEKSEIEGWAKISVIPYPEVVKMKIYEWIVPWFKALNFNNKMIVSINLLSAFTFIIMLFKKDLILVKIQMIIFINLIFWFLSAPDPRFAYGFLFVGFSLTIAYVIKLAELSFFPGVIRYIKFGLGCFLFLIICRRIMFPVDTLRHPSLWIVSAPFGKVEAKNYYSNFEYRVPVPEGGCFNVEIPCVPFPLSDVVLRGKVLQEGFKTIHSP
jgi:hypothetical protein